MCIICQTMVAVPVSAGLVLSGVGNIPGQLPAQFAPITASPWARSVAEPSLLSPGASLSPVTPWAVGLPADVDPADVDPADADPASVDPADADSPAGGDAADAAPSGGDMGEIDPDSIRSQEEIDADRAAAEENQRQREQERLALQENLNHVGSALAQAWLDLNSIEARLPLAQVELDEARSDVVSAQAQADALARRLEEAHAQEADVAALVDQYAHEANRSREDVARLAREQARTGGQVTTFGLITGAQSAEEFVRDAAIASSVARSQSRTLANASQSRAVAQGQEARLGAIRLTIADLLEAAEANVLVAQEAQTRAQDRYDEVADLLAAQNRIAANLEQQQHEYLVLLGEVEAAEAQLERDIAALDAQQAERDLWIEQERQREAERIEQARLAREAEERAQREAQERAQREEEERLAREREEAERAAALDSAGAQQAQPPASQPPASQPPASQPPAGQPSADGGVVAQPAPTPTAPPAGSALSDIPGHVEGHFLSWPTHRFNVTSHFGMRFHPILQINRLHAGIDFGEPCGTPILAAASGVVLQAGWLNSGAGNGVIIDHGTYNGQRIQTRSYHLERVDVRAGQGVSRGQVLGTVGTTGMSTGCHLHFEVLTDGTFVNPYPWLRR